jgi:COP9 signalosome complex subunit 7
MRLLTALSLPSTDALELLIREATYAGLLTAKLSPSAGLIHISGISPLRDLAPGALMTMQATLKDWDERCVEVLADLEAQVEEVKRLADEERGRESAMREVLEKALKDGKKGKRKRVRKRVANEDLMEAVESEEDEVMEDEGEEEEEEGDGNGDGDEMDVDDGEKGRGRTGTTSPKGTRKTPRGKSGRGGKVARTPKSERP